jgi:DNA repair exonuclease SbcCD ATPase subunit
MFYNRLQKILIKNFCSIQSAELDVPNQRLTQIVGINNDDDMSPSNGSGKSTIKSALCWNLFGQTETGRGADSILPWNDPRNCEVSSVWSNGQNTLTINRYRSHKEKKNTVEIYADGENLTGKDNDDTQRMIDGYLGFNYDLFCLLLTTGMTSKKMKDFMVMTDKEKKEFVGFLLDLSFLESAQNNAKQKAKELESELQKIHEEGIGVSAKIESVTQSLEENRRRADAHMRQIEEDIVRRQNDTERRSEEIKAKRERLEVIRAQVREVVIPDAPDMSIIDQQRKQIKAYQDNNATHQVTKSKKTAEVLSLTESLGKDPVVDENEPSIMKAKSALVSAERELMVTENINTSSFTDKTVEKYRAAIANTEATFNVIQQKINSLHDVCIEDTCPTCKQSLQEDVVADLKLKNVIEIQNANDDLKAQKEKLEDLKAKSEKYVADKIKEIKDNKESRLSDLKVEVARLRCAYDDAKKAEYTRLCAEKNIDGIKAKITAIQSEIATIESIINVNTKNAAEIEASLATQEPSARALNAKILELTQQKASLKSQFASLKAEYDNLKARLDAERQSLEKLTKEKIQNPYLEFVKKDEASLQTLSDAQKNILERQEEIKGMLQYVTFWVDGFGDKGIKSYILDSVTELLEQKANFALSYITNGNMSLGFCTQKKNKNDTIKDEFTVEIFRDGLQVQFIDLSKGERCRVSFAVNYALKALGSYYHGLNLNFEWYDEILDGLDEIGCYQVIQFLRRELTNYESIFVVSHNENIKGMFDKNLVIEKTEGWSVLRNEV